MADQKEDIPEETTAPTEQPSKDGDKVSALAASNYIPPRWPTYADIDKIVTTYYNDCMKWEYNLVNQCKVEDLLKESPYITFGNWFRQPQMAPEVQKKKKSPMIGDKDQLAIILLQLTDISDSLIKMSRSLRGVIDMLKGKDTSDDSTTSDSDSD